MGAPTKASDIDLTPIPGKQYFNLEREWREEFIYFLVIDRFHDDKARSPVLQPHRSNSISTPDDFFGGKIRGITNHRDYITGLGRTAIWLSPIFENNLKAYHGYDINNYLSVAPHFAQVMRSEILDAGAFSSRFDDMPDGFRCEGLSPDLSWSAYSTEDGTWTYLRCIGPLIHGALGPTWNWNCADVLSFANQVGYYPTFLAYLKILPSRVPSQGRTSGELAEFLQAPRFQSFRIPSTIESKQ